MMRLALAALVGLWMTACDTAGDIGPFPDSGAPTDGWIPGNDQAVDVDVGFDERGPFTPLNAIQVKGYHRSNWYQQDPDPTRDVDYQGHDRPHIGLQLTEHDARVMHFGVGQNGVQGFHLGSRAHWGARYVQPEGREGDCEAGLERMQMQSNCGQFMRFCFDFIFHGSDYFEEAFALGGLDRLHTERHAPIFILIEPQPQMYSDERLACFDQQELLAEGIAGDPFLPGYEINPAHFFEAGEVFRPRELQGEFATLRDAVTTRGWPGMDQLWGRFVFILYEKGEVRAAYRERTGLDWPEQGMSADDPHYFVLADDPEDPDAAFFSLPASETEQIRDLVERGFIVHAHSLDADEIEGARRAGAQLLTTLELGDIATNGPAVCNGVAPSDVACDPRHFEPPSLEGR